MATATPRPPATLAFLLLTLLAVVVLALAGAIVTGTMRPGAVTQLDINAAPPHGQGLNS